MRALPQPRHRLFQPPRQRCGLGAFFLLLVDHLFRRAGDEIGIFELGVDSGDFAFGLLQFLFEARAFPRKVDDIAQRQACDRLTDDELRGAMRNRVRDLDTLQARECLNHVAVAFEA